MVAFAVETKKCSMCNQVLSLDDANFYCNRQHGKNYFSRHCIKCTCLRRRIRYGKKKGANVIELLEKSVVDKSNFSPTGENDLENAIQIAENSCVKAYNLYLTAREWRKLGIMDDENVHAILKRWTEQEKLVTLLKATLPRTGVLKDITKHIILVS